MLPTGESKDAERWTEDQLQSYIQILNCAGVAVSDLHVVQGSTVFASQISDIGLVSRI